MLIMKPKDQQEFTNMLIEKDIIGLDPRYNLITPFDLVLGTYTKGYQGAKAVWTGTKLIRLGFSGFGRRSIAMGVVDLYGFISKVENMYSHFSQSIGQDGKPGAATPPVPPMTPIGTKPSKPTRSGSTSKPFWSSGKPKCKKGFRYDFKRKLCVKIK